MGGLPIEQGFAIAFLFVPMSQVAYSYLPKGKNNKASSLANLFRNQGGSFGVAFVTTMLERRSQFHQSVLVSHLTPSDLGVRAMLDRTTQFLVTQGASPPDALHQAYGVLAATLSRQAAILAFLDCFLLLGLVAIIGVPLAFCIRRFQAGSPGAGGH